MAPESSLSEATRAALNNSQVIDLTTTGRRTGQLRRIEIFLHNDHGQLFITGMPRADRTRDWIYNIEADSNVVIHLKQSVVADVPATARVVTGPNEGRPLIEAAARRWGRTDVPDMLRHSPLIVLRAIHLSRLRFVRAGRARVVWRGGGPS
jgi:deazaflavin-dependent oxidoreductase (nitroreductase family)